MDHVKGALGPLFPKVMELLNLVEYKMEIEPLEPDWESLKRELVSLQSKLQFLKAEGRYIDAELGRSVGSRLAVEVWAEVRELSYDVEDVVDNYLACLEGSEPIPDIDTLRKLVQKMADLQPAENIPMDAVIDHVVARPASTTTIDPSVQAMYTEIRYLVGISGNMDRLTDMISSDMNHMILFEEPTGTSDKVSSKDPAWPIADKSQYKDEDMPSQKRPRIAWDVGFGGKSDVPAGTSENMSSNDSWPILYDSQYEDKKMPSIYKPKIACVVGFGGLGKTTLVRTLYDKIEKDFSCKAFVSVGQTANEKKVLMDILLDLERDKKVQSYTKSGLARFDVRRLLKELQEFLCKKRYLIVIDDIWNEKLWELIECAFYNERHLGSQVFTTTRSVNVAKACCSSSDGRLIYQMKPLSDEDSKSLFYSRVFSQEGGQCPPSFKQVSAAIVEKCGGVPLAIITIASLLASNGEGRKPMDEWNHLLNSIGRGLTEGDSVVEMNRILSLSYNDLPPELKNCLLCIAVFPEDYQIKKDRLVSMWIAEAFVQRTNQEDSLFEIGDNYFNMLINRSMIEPVEIDDEGKAKACRVHDMVLGFLCSLSREANFVSVIDASTRTTSNSETKIRRLSIQDCKETPMVAAQLSAGSMGMSHVRSFTLWSYHHPDNNLVPPLSSFQVIRVLDLRDCYLGRSFHQTNPWYVKSLLHVRYLSLSHTKIDVLPADIGKLKFLQILDLGGNYIEELPSSIVELRQLICLRVEPKTRLPDEFGKLTSLEELTHVKVNHHSAYVAKQLGYLSKLRVLEITPDDMDESLATDFVDSLNKLLEIRILKLRGSSLSTAVKYIKNVGENWKPSSHLQKFQADDNSCFRLLPNWIIESSNLCSLSIWLKKVRGEDFDVLGRLQYLRYLKLTQENRDDFYLARQEEGFEFENDLFPVLREYLVEGFVTLPSMFPKGAMPKVQKLQFDVRVEDFGNMNLEMGHLPALKEVKVNIRFNEDEYYANGENYWLHPRMNDGKAALRAVADLHPNHPTIHFTTGNGGKIAWVYDEVEDEDESADEEEDEDEDESEYGDEAQTCSSDDVEAVDVQTGRQP